MVYKHHYISQLGVITLASNGKALTGLWFDGQKHFPHKLISESTEAELPIFTQAIYWLDTYFVGEVPDFTPPISLNTTPFRKAVYEILLSIPYGQTMTYGEIADIIAEQKRIHYRFDVAVATAVADSMKYDKKRKAA